MRDDPTDERDRNRDQDDGRKEKESRARSSSSTTASDATAMAVTSDRAARGDKRKMDSRCRWLTQEILAREGMV